MRLTGRIATLLAHGLSDTQARVYLAVLDHSGSTVGPLARLTRMPRSRIYEAIEELNAMGLVDVRIGRSRTYSARSFAEYAARCAEEMRGRAALLDSQCELLAATFKSRPAPEAEAPTARVLLGRAAAEREIDRMLSEARASVALSVGAGVAARVLRLVDPVAAARPDLDIHVVVASEAARVGGLERYEAVFARVGWTSASLGGVVLSVDDRETLLVHAGPQEGGSADREIGFHLEHRAFARDFAEVVRALGRPSALVDVRR